MDPLLVLSATIEPCGVPQLALADPALRRRQYLDAVMYWLRAFKGHRLVFVENSGADLSEFQALAAAANGVLEIIGLPNEPYPPSLGKGYGEFRMIDAAVTQSRLMRDASHFAKITGRLTVRNMPNMWRRLPPAFDLIADAFPIAHEPNGGRTDSRLVFFSTAFYREQATGLYQTMNDAGYFFAEHAIWRLMQTAPPSARIFTRLPVEPAWQGTSGTYGADYGDLKSRLKRPFKRLRRARDRWLGRPSVQAVRSATQSSVPKKSL